MINFIWGVSIGLRLADWKGVHLFKSGFTRHLYQEFIDSFGSGRSCTTSQPFVYVEPQATSVRLLADVLEGKDGGWEIYAVSAGEEEINEDFLVDA